MTLKLRHWLILAFGLELKHCPFLGLEPLGFQTRTYTIGSAHYQGFKPRLKLHMHSLWPPACQLLTLGFVIPHNCTSQFFLINLYYGFSFSEESWLTWYPKILVSAQDTFRCRTHANTLCQEAVCGGQGFQLFFSFQGKKKWGILHFYVKKKKR